MFTSEILIVEDTLDRRDAFRRNFYGQAINLEFAENVLDAVRAIRTRKYDYIFLDHDLSDRDLTGADVASCMFNSLNYHTPVWVHSWNPEGVDKIMAIFKYMEVDALNRAFQDTPEFWYAVNKWVGVLDDVQQTASEGG